MDMTVQTLKYIHTRRGCCNAVKEEPEKTPEPEPVQPKPKIITEDAVNEDIEQNPDTVSNYLRNERAMKAQRKQMNARSLLNNVFFNYFVSFYCVKQKMPYKRKANPGTVQLNKLKAELPEKR